MSALEGAPGVTGIVPGVVPAVLVLAGIVPAVLAGVVLAVLAGGA